jgi:ADP-dependent NAD(P)H-hydrate dehydratase / NAD(P)H-hydrate epimerase
MLPVFTVSQMRAIDSRAICGDVAVGYSFMVKAGAGVFDAIKKLIPDTRSGEIAVICGKGNNGGDGFVVSRLLLIGEYRVMCFGLCGPEKLRYESRLAYDQYIACGGNFLLLDDPEDLGDLSRYTLVVDAILGTGMKGSPHGLTAEVITAINKSGAMVLAVDTPSGLDNDSGVPGNPCVKAMATVTIGFPKIGAFFHPGKTFVGEYSIKDIGYPKEIVEGLFPSLFFPTMEKLKKFLPERKPSGSKFDHGVTALLCGSLGMTGSAVLASKAALRTGCGMAHLFAPKSALLSLSMHLVEVVLHGIDETPDARPAFSSAGFFRDFAEGVQAVCIGPGISHGDETSRLVRDLVATLKVPVVLDADGINAFKGCAADLKIHSSDLVITPHRGEWARLFSPLPDRPEEAIEELRKTARDYAMTILYKGSPTIVAAPSGEAFVLPYGNSGMATAGCGDILSGCIASLIAQGCKPTNAAVLGAFIHGRAGEAASGKYGEHAMIASDVLEAFPSVIKTLAVQH